MAFLKLAVQFDEHLTFQNTFSIVRYKCRRSF